MKACLTLVFIVCDAIRKLIDMRLNIKTCRCTYNTMPIFVIIVPQSMFCLFIAATILQSLCTRLLIMTCVIFVIILFELHLTPLIVPVMIVPWKIQEFEKDLFLEFSEISV